MNIATAAMTDKTNATPIALAVFDDPPREKGACCGVEKEACCGVDAGAFCASIPTAPGELCAGLAARHAVWSASYRATEPPLNRVNRIGLPAFLAINTPAHTFPR
jgi:hypothetical protein